MADIAHRRIVEIGDKPFVKRGLPDQVTYFSTWADDDPRRLKADGSSVVSLRTLAVLCRALRAPETDLVVCHPTFFSPWHWRWTMRALFDRRTLRRSVSFVRTMGPQVLRWPISAPIAVLDQTDLPLINRNNFFLLDRCRIYFKRELPPDRWRLFMKTGHANLPTPRFRVTAPQQARIDKLRPISLGLPLSATTSFPVEPSEKSVDIFFAGKIDGSSHVRRRGLGELLALRERGIAVDIPERALPQSEFYRRCARAWLTWSPEGLGWDCFRHYEAAACGSVPVINQPTIERHQPLLHGIHAIYYDIEEGGLTGAVRAALADKQRLDAIGRAAGIHVLAHHTLTTLARHIVRASLDPVASAGAAATAP
jgi:hypothetical protein